MIQEILVGLIFVAALMYIGRLVFRSFQSESACATGCGKCGVDFTKVEKQLKERTS